MKKDVSRCGWCGDDSLYVRYHDEDWGVPVHDDQQLLEKLILDGAQAGLSWITILRKRENYRDAFDGFDPEKIARYDERKIEELMSNAGIVRNRLKINAAITNSKKFLELQKESGSFDQYLWQFVGGRTIDNKIKSMNEIPSKSAESIVMSKDLQKRGFKFVGPTICYAFMQAVGMINDHQISCFRHKEV
ncbi:MAG: DNA-3-methyladenine glycosylase I [Abditibacteriaceae bacterium]